MTCISLCAIFLTDAHAGTGARERVRAGTDRANDRAAKVAETDTIPSEGSVRGGLVRQAETLFEAGRYYEASIAWERVLFENNDPQQQIKAVAGKTECLKMQGLYDPAVTFLETWQAFPFPDTSLASLHYQLVLCNYLGGHFENTISLVDRWSYEHHGREPDPLLVVLKILSLNELQRWTEAGETYHVFITSYRSSVLPPDPYEHLPHLKSVRKATTLATFIPGGGQFYAGKPGEAIFSILVQAAGIWFAVVSFEEHYYVSAWLVGAALFGAFHLGGVRRSEVLVQRYNRRRVQDFNEKVRGQLLSVIAGAKAAP